MGTLKRRIIEAEEPKEEPPMDVSGWIPVSERLPKGGEPIVLGFGGGYALPSMAEWKNGGLVWCHRPNIVGSSGGPNTPTHWMPLPAPPTDAK